ALDGVDRAQAAGDLDGHLRADRSADRLDDVPLDRLACPGATEVDDVEPPCARLAERLGDTDGVVRVPCLASEVSLAQPDDTPVPQVDRGEHLERVRLTCCAHRVIMVAL